MLRRMISAFRTVFIIGCAVDRAVCRITENELLRRTGHLPSSGAPRGITAAYTAQNAGFCFSAVGQTSAWGIAIAAVCGLTAAIAAAVSGDAGSRTRK